MWRIVWNKLTDVLTYDAEAPMLFSSGIFLWLFLAFVAIYLLLHKRDAARIAFVTAFSYYFYYKSSGCYFFLLGIVTISDYLIGRRMATIETKWKRRLLLAASLAVNLGLLCYFKYTNFFYELLSPLWGGHFHALDIFLPVGISFFTFQSLSYTIDIYRRQLHPLRRLLDYAFYVSFFPQLVAGPIVRARDFIPQIHRPLLVTQEMFGQGIFFILSGLFKKAVISDYISINFVERIFDNPALFSGVENLFGIYGYALQIYCDFSGYSDMAIGIALLLGFRFPLNFRSPYKSENVTDFWRRWHISLSTWLRDYLYISLGGNRKGQFRTYLHLIATMLLGGLWHGASWNFVVWGGLHGIALAGHKWWRNLKGKPKTAVSHGWKKIVSIVVTFHFACFCWVFFRNSTFESSVTMLTQVFADFRPGVFTQLVSGYKPVFLLMVIGYLLHWAPDSWQDACTRTVIRMPLTCKAFLLIALIYLVIQIKSAAVQPFIYFQF
ncbi:MBOAT family protein [Phocaeicola abscessus]|uniref:MBOAT family O-acyltransferase n=1 Tax=Phocaeicola abscessus TaxID=555313 RepID=UPI0028EF59C9|nr:MBOAT family protein [Phocaeicola abscessus]